MERSNDRGRSRAGRATRQALPAAALAILLASCVAVPVPIPIPVITGIRTGPAPAAGAPATTFRYDPASMSAEEAGAYAREACAEDGATLATLTRAGPSAATADQPTITYTCRQ